uniref:Retrotransposon protein, putative, unclassified n=1 Tax=Oryza sativa subsp. japonica TaxID=39947 RepID=Q2QST4_ORYSJ|nr:retrotransposon protein, putative, unclassified [Oryza sativa Japonica Group]
MAEERESFESQWAPSGVTEENLKEMVAHGVFPAKEIIGWRPAFGEVFPTPNTHEVVVFSHFFCGRFSLPTSRFFQGILNFYGISLHHLNPKSIVHIANFIHACEAFLGIRPHFALLCRIFFLKPQPNKSKPCVVGAAGFQLRGTLSQKYFSVPFKTSNKGWHANWFYVQNPEPTLPEYSCLPPVYQDTWNSLPMGNEAAQAVELMDRMIKLKEQVDNGRYYAQQFALMKSDPPIAQRRSPRHQTGQGSGGPKIRSKAQPNTSNLAGQPDSRKRKLVLSDDEGDDARKPGDKETIGKLPKQANPKKKTSSRPMPKIRKSSRKPSDIDPSGKDSDPTNMETSSSKETGPTAKDHPRGNQPATDNDASNGPRSGSPTKAQESTRPRPEIIIGPMIGDEEEILRIRAAEDSRPPILVKWWDDDMQPQGIVINRKKEDEEVCLQKKALSQATRIVNRIHLRNEAKTATLEKLVPHLGTLEAIRDQLHEAKELAKKTEHDLRDRIAELQESNFELTGSSKDRKIKSQAQFDVLVGKIKRLEGARDEVANAATPLVQAMFFNNNGPSTFDASEIFDKLRVAPDTYFKNIKEVGSMGASLALAMTKSLYPKIDIDAVDGFADGTSEEAALDLINDAQKAADKTVVDVVERFQDTDL